jgi:hypothetical protein
MEDPRQYSSWQWIGIFEDLVHHVFIRFAMAGWHLVDYLVIDVSSLISFDIADLEFDKAKTTLS